MTLKQKVYDIVNPNSDSANIFSKIFDVSIITLIILNVATIIIDTFQIPEWLSNVMTWIEIVSEIAIGKCNF